VIKLSPTAALAAFFLALGIVSPALSQQPDPSSEATIEEERLLGSADDEARARELLPFTRSFGASGIVAGALAPSAAAVGVPPAAMLEAVRAFEGAPERRDPQDGDAFYVRWEQTYTIDGDPIGIGRVLWAELKAPDGATVAIHRFRPREGGEQFFLTTGEAAMPPAIAVPVEDVNVSSRFGYRTDPMARASATRPPAAAGVGGPQHRQRATRQAQRLFAGFGPRLFMHEGVDFAVPQGTPVYAAADGVVAGAKPNGGYGNYIRIEHDNGVATAYGHLSRFAPGIKPGAKVARGELVGFSGNTGRSTGPHLHFEVLSDGKPVDPLTHATIAQLGGTDLERFAKKVAEDERVRANEARVTE
jgi:murein DD-endopeptidase MepM/ murein hydrolase activator NlpD